MTFGAAYYLGGESAITAIEGISGFTRYLYCFFFSVQAMSTIGFGYMSPLSIYANCLVTMEVFFSYFYETFILSLVLSKYARPTLLRRNVHFSRHGCCYRSRDDDGHHVLVFRCSNVRHKTPMISATFKLLCILKDLGPPNSMDDPDKKAFRVMELPFHLHDGCENPYLPIPYEVRHVIDDHSPLSRFVSVVHDGESWKKAPFEIVAVVEGTDSGTSDSYQAVMSYLPSDIELNRSFMNCVYYSYTRRKYVIDYERFESTQGTYD